MSLGYPTGPCKKQYQITPEMIGISIMHIKSISDQYGIQVEITLKPDEIKLKFIKKIGSNVKKTEKTFLNEELASKFNFQTFNSMIFEVSNSMVIN